MRLPPQSASAARSGLGGVASPNLNPSQRLKVVEPYSRTPPDCYPRCMELCHHWGMPIEICLEDCRRFCGPH